MRDRGVSSSVTTISIALVGNPNSGKTTVFNALTGLRQKVGNYPGVTVEKKEGRLTFDDGTEARVFDLPGTYSLTATSPDEIIVTDILLGRGRHTPAPDLAVCIIDASNLERSLYLVSQVIDGNVPTIIALNMIDVAQDSGIHVDHVALSREIGIPVVPTIASRGIGIPELKRAMQMPLAGTKRQWRLPDAFEKECEELVGLLEETHNLNQPAAFHEALTLLSASTASLRESTRYKPELLEHVKRDHQKLDFLGFDRGTVIIESRYYWIKRICRDVMQSRSGYHRTRSDRIDAIVTHKVWGILIFLTLMALIFQAMFAWANIPMHWIANCFESLASAVDTILPPGDLRDLIVRGGIGGVAAVVTFLPQILFLFLFLGLLEGTGYMARGAFIMDRLMSKVGLHGKSFIPLLSSFACAIPGIMATRTIDNPRDRLATMLVAPLMTCSARIPVYTLLIAAFVPNLRIFGFLSLPGAVLFALYALGFLAAMGVAWVFKKTFLKSTTPAFIMELAPYKFPTLKSILLQLWEKGTSFLQRAGTIILGVSIVLWFLATYPKLDNATPGEKLNHSFAGRAGHVLEPVIRPLGFDWRIGIGMVGSLLQREVFVSTMGTIYNIQDAQGSNGTISLQDHLRNDRDAATGAPTFTLLTALCLMVYYALAMQCMSTVVIMYRETGGWKWPAVQFAYMSALAYGATLAAYRIGLAAGLGG